MRGTKKELKYAAEHFNEVRHTTLNPEGPGVVRIHLIPPNGAFDDTPASVAIINGQDVIPVNFSWTILLTELIDRINRFSGREVSDEEVKGIVNDTCKAVRKIYPFVSSKRLKADIDTIMTTFTDVARGKIPETPVTYVSLGEYAPFMRAPHRMDLMVSAMTKDGCWHCNQNCVHCYAAGQTQSEEAELTTDEWKQILNKCREIGIPQVTFTGGEPTMRDDLVELITHAAWFVTRLNTNGIRLTPDYCAKLKEASLDSLQITFYSSDESIHNSLVGAERYKDTVAGIENALAAGISLSVNTPLCISNSNYTETLRFLHDKGVQYVTCSGLITTGKAAGGASESLQLTPAQIREILTEAVGYCYSNGMEISFTSPGWVGADFCKELGINTPSCGAGLSNMAITPGGNVVPCQSWLSGEPLGNFLKDEWKDIWESPACRERRDYSALMRCECPLRVRQSR